MTAAPTPTTNTKGPKMKTIISALALSLAASVAGAETINLGPVGCGIVKQCYSIPNDTGAVVNLYGAPGYPYFFLYIDNMEYIANVPSDRGFDTTMVTPDGQTAHVTGAFTTYTTCVRSGRGQHCSVHWQFVGGSVVR